MRFRRHRQYTQTEIRVAKRAAEESAEAAEIDVNTQRERLNEERATIVPTIRQLHDQNHVAQALMKIIEGAHRREQPDH